jgi:hypothetical protein
LESTKVAVYIAGVKALENPRVPPFLWIICRSPPAGSTICKASPTPPATGRVPHLMKGRQYRVAVRV